jgi:hypothetical protein
MSIRGGRKSSDSSERDWSFLDAKLVQSVFLEKIIERLYDVEIPRSRISPAEAIRFVRALRSLSIRQPLSQKGQPLDGSSGQNKISGCPARRASFGHVARATLANLWMTVGVPVDLFQLELRLFIPNLSSHLPEFFTSWLSEALFPHYLIEQAFVPGRRFRTRALQSFHSKWIATRNWERFSHELDRSDPSRALGRSKSLQTSR